MDNSTQPNEMLMKYLDDELTSGEREVFEKQLAIDAALRRELEDLQTARAAVKLYGLKEQVGSIHYQMMAEMKPHGVVRSISPARRAIRYSLAIAASIFLVAVVIIGYNFFTLSPERLYNNQYHTYELSAVRGGANSASQLEMDYQRGQYTAVIEDRQKMQNANPKDEFLAGIAYLQTSNISAAISSFQSVIEKNRSANTSIFNDDAQYYLALTYLRNKDYDRCLDLIQTIRNNPSHLYHDQFSSGFVRKVKRLRWRQS
jgi:tetratricopeptide (TPR) repeat protein